MIGCVFNSKMGFLGVWCVWEEWMVKVIIIGSKWINGGFVVLELW